MLVLVLIIGAFIFLKIKGSSFMGATDSTDGIRVTFKKGDIVPSGNAPELRCYVESYDLVKAKLIVSSRLNRICDAGT